MQLHAIFTRLAGAALLLSAVSAPAAAADPLPVPANEATVVGNSAAHAGHAAKPGADEPKKICRRLPSTTSRLKTTRVCLTREQWRNATYK